MAIDRYGRRIHYLRISLTDHCNLRCIYCMPDDVSFKPNSELMQDDEILRFVRLFTGLGFDKFRLTGGEPTVRAGIVDLVRAIAHTDGVRSLTMTTNGILLSRFAKPLAEAGLQRVNLSLDTLDPEKYKFLTRRGNLQDFWDGVKAAEEAGLTPIKVNAVIAKDHNEGDVIDLARLTVERPWQVRFIELMPFAGATEFQQTQEVRTENIIDWIEAEFGKMEVVNFGKLDGEARVYRIPGAKGTIGFIATVSHPFCETCSRARLTADGRLRMCLLRENEVDLLGPMRRGATDAELRSMIQEGIWEKPWGHRLEHDEVPLNRMMSQIGG